MNSPEDFRANCKQYYRIVYSFFLRKKIPEEICKELTQETFLNATRNLESFQGDALITTWLFKIALNVWRNHCRSAHTQKRDAVEISLTVVEEDPSQNHPSPESNVIQLQHRRILNRAIGSLPEKMQRCIHLRLNEGMKYKDIAALMDVSLDTVKSLVYQAKTRLKSALAPSISPKVITQTQKFGEGHQHD